MTEFETPPGPDIRGIVLAVSRYRSPETPEQALAEALYLKLVAPGESEASACRMLAEQNRGRARPRRADGGDR